MHQHTGDRVSLSTAAEVGFAGGPTSWSETPGQVDEYIGRLQAVGTPTLRHGTYASRVKPVLDRVGALVLLVAVAPILAVTALLVRAFLGRGVIFKQERTGLNGEPFTVYKFRTMRPCQRAQRQPFDGEDRRKTHKTIADPRHTALGRFLRMTSIDELPQLFNVLLGDMSLVGPRPELVDIVMRYAPVQHRRHEVKPGITGLWQISHRDGGLMHENSDADLEYVEKVSFATDLRILLATIPAVLLRRGF